MFKTFGKVKKKMKKLFLILLIIYCKIGFPQVFETPVYYSKSHETLYIDKIEISNKNTVFYLHIENIKDAGDAWFCADKDIYVKEAGTGKKHQLIKSSGIPVCPENHKFNKKGEKLFFQLYFDKIESDKIKKIDLVENCSDYCFSFTEIILDNKLSNEIKSFEKAIILMSSNKNSEALKEFSEFEKNVQDKNTSRYAYFLYASSLLSYKTQDFNKAKTQYEKLKNSTLKDRDELLEKLNEIEFFNK